MVAKEMMISMENRYTSYEAGQAVEAYQNTLDNIIESLDNNFEDMDFENADARTEMLGIINSIKDEINQAKNGLSGLSFED